MRKATGVLVIILFLLSIGSLIIGNKLFTKRELLKGRTQKLEESVIKVGKLIEAEAPKAPDIIEADFPAKDISPVKAELVEKPDTSAFWAKYKRELEVLDTPALDLGNETNKNAMMNLYKISPLDGTIMKDGQGYSIKTGEGTMASVLDGILIEKAREQYERLNETRLQLKDLRIELAANITEINKLKPELRARLKEIVELKAEIERLNNRIADLEKQVADLEAEKKRLEEEITQLKTDIANMQEELEDKDRKIKDLEKRVGDLSRVGGDTSGPTTDMGPWKPSPGLKGKIVTVNPEWNFVVVEITDEFIAESLAAGRTDPAGAELLVKRLGPPEQFVTKIRLVQVKGAQKLAIADNLTNWQQLPIKEGDALFY